MHPDFIIHLTPFAGIIISQLGADAGKLSVYGPLGIICAWLLWQWERQRTDHLKIQEAVREDNEKLRVEVRSLVHEFKGLNRNLLYITATHGPDNLRSIAEKELKAKLAAEDKT